MSALGLTTQISTVHQARIKLILLATPLFIWLLVGGAAINQTGTASALIPLYGHSIRLLSMP